MQIGAAKIEGGMAVVRYIGVELYTSQKETQYLTFNFVAETEGTCGSTRYYVPVSDLATLSAMVQMLKGGQAVSFQNHTPEALYAEVVRQLQNCAWQGRAYINENGIIASFILPSDVYIFSWAGWSNPLSPIWISPKWNRPMATALLQVAEGPHAGTRVRYNVGAGVIRDSKGVVRGLPSENLARLIEAFLDDGEELRELERNFPSDDDVFIDLGNLLARKRRLVKGVIDTNGRLLGQTLTRSDQKINEEQEQEQETPAQFAWDELAEHMAAISSILNKGIIEQDGRLTQDGSYIARNVLAPIVDALQAYGFNMKRTWRDPSVSPNVIGMAASLMYLVREEILSQPDNLMYVGESEQSHRALNEWAAGALQRWGLTAKQSDEF